MVVAIIFNLFHPRRRGFVIRSTLLVVVVLFVLLWFTGLNDDSDSRLLVKDNLQFVNIEEHKQNERLGNKAHQELDGAIMIPPVKQKDVKADELSANQIFKDEDKQIQKVDTRTSEEKLLDEEIEAMNSKIVPGAGMNGRPVELKGAEKTLADSLMKKEAFNIIASDKISYRRSVPDNRNEKCNYIQYPENLPNVSVIIIFTNEAWSPLIRTIYSVMDRTPDSLLHEIILLDDYSDRPEMKRRLERFLELNFPKKVKLIRATKRLGLIRARLAGARVATGEVVMFLDSHCEVNIGWLEPLVARIKENRKVALVPIIEVIDDKTMHYYSSGSDFFQVGSFTWSGHFTWVNIPDRELKRRGDSLSPTRSATMAGGLFAMDRNYFWELGGYDEGMDVWGGENLELSFRVWMCGGSLETIPCSRVGHIFRSFHPYTFPGNKDTHGINTKRMAEVWMDDYKRLFYLYRPDLLKVQHGNVTDRKLLRQKLKCQDFKWYLDNIVSEKFILDEDSFAYGRVRNGHDLCLDFLQKDEETDYQLGLYYCHTTIAMSQYFSFSKNHELRRESTCATASSHAFNSEIVIMSVCFPDDPDQKWKFTVNGPIIHVSSKRCLDSFNSSVMQYVWVRPCDGSPTQKWKFDNYIAGNAQLKNL